MKFAKVIDTTDGGQVLATLLKNEQDRFELKLTTAFDGIEVSMTLKPKEGQEQLALDSFVLEGADNFREMAKDQTEDI